MSQSPIVDRIRLIPRPEDFLNRNIGSSGELYYSKSAKTLRVYDGTIRSGYEVVTENNIRRNAASQEVATVRYPVTVTRNDDDTANVYNLNGSVRPTIDWIVGYTYYFDQSDPTNLYFPNPIGGSIFNQHPLEFSAIDPVEHVDHAGSDHVTYKTGVIYMLEYEPVTRAQYISNFASSDHRAIQITITSTAPETLYYYCINHLGMGNSGTKAYPGSGSGGGGGGDAVGGASIEVSDNAPTAPTSGDLWFQSTTGRLLVYVVDEDAGQWVQPAAVTPDAPDIVIDYADVINKPTFATVATTGDYADLINTPAINIPTTITDLGITDGTADQVLTTDGAGNFSFSDSGVDLTAFSVLVNSASGDGDLLYDNTTGQFTYTPPAGSGGSSFNQDLNTTNAVTFATVTSGDFITAGTSAPTIDTSSTLTITTTDGLIVNGTGAFRFPRLTTNERNTVAALDGDVVYNTTVNRFQGRQNGAWINLDDGTAG
jgi:hypothetical protein